MSTTTTKNPTPAELRRLFQGDETEGTTYLVGRTETVFAMLRLDDEGYPRDWFGIVRETEILPFTKYFQEEGDRVEFVPLNIALPDIDARDTPCRMRLTASADKSHATLLLFRGKGRRAAK